MTDWKNLVRNENSRLGITTALILLIGAAIAALAFTFRMPATEEKTVQKFPYAFTGTFDYVAHLKPNTIFNTTTLESGKSDPVLFTKLIDRFDFTYTFQTKVPESVQERPLEYEIVGVLSPDQTNYKKETILVPRKAASGDFTQSFTVRLGDVFQDLSSLRQQTAISADKPKYSIEVRVYPQIPTEYGVIRDKFVQTLNLTLGNSEISLSSRRRELKDSLVQVEEVARKDVILYRTLAVISFIVVLVLSLAWAWIVHRVNQLPFTPEDFLATLRQNHGDIVIEAVRLPPAKPNQAVVHLRSIDDLVRAADSLMKPVIAVQKGSGYLLTVIDNMDGVRYQLHTSLNGATASITDFATPSESERPNDEIASMRVNPS